MRTKITLNCPWVLNYQLTQDVLEVFEERGIASARIKFYGEFQRRGFVLSANLWTLKNIIDSWDEDKNL